MSNPESAALPTWRAGSSDRGGRFQGADYGSDVSFFVVHMTDGQGPALHSHPYSETFVVLRGRARFRLGDRSIEVTGGDVVIAPPESPHAFRAVGPDVLEMVDIHAAPRMVTTWLESE